MEVGGAEGRETRNQKAETRKSRGRKEKRDFSSRTALGGEEVSLRSK